jgi:hypothetical protein
MTRNIIDANKEPVATVTLEGAEAFVDLVNPLPTRMTAAQTRILRDALGQALREARKAQRKAVAPPKDPEANAPKKDASPNKPQATPDPKPSKRGTKKATDDEAHVAV